MWIRNLSQFSASSSSKNDHCCFFQLQPQFSELCSVERPLTDNRTPNYKTDPGAFISSLHEMDIAADRDPEDLFRITEKIKRAARQALTCL
jgi:hypothetical protein